MVFPKNQNFAIVKDKMRLESTVSFHEYTLSTYKHTNSEFRILFVPIPGPLVSCSIVVPTLNKCNKGLPHTLEHLIFCGSCSTPHRGYLDNLATRCLSTGSNAYTDQDHTCYEICTAGSEGMINILPVFLDHILHPTLRERQFQTEVFHYDGNAKKQGVVYCEMSSRENTEADLLDLNLRKLLYSEVYSFECGGLTPDIAQLSNEQVKAYHKEFYHLNNMTIVLCGMISPELVFDKLSLFLQNSNNVEKSVSIPRVSIQPLTTQQESQLSCTVPFPSSDYTVGSIGFGWRGPSSDDILSITALEVLFRYFQGNAASPICQAFVERANPYASNVDFELKGYLETSMFLIFSGVAHPSDGLYDGTDDGTDEEDSYEDSDEESDQDSYKSINSQNESKDESKDTLEIEKDQLFEPNVFKNLLFQVFQDFIHTSTLEQEQEQEREFINVIERQCRKILEALEEDPHETITNALVPDIIRYHLAPKRCPKDINSTNTSQFGTRGSTLNILTELKNKKLSFWKDLTRKWLLDAPVAQVYMTPDTRLGMELSQKTIQEQEQLAESLGKDGLHSLQMELEAALDENKIDLPLQLISSMPPIPNVSTVSQLAFESQVLELRNSCFHRIQIVETNTSFVHYRFAFNTRQGDFPSDLRPWLVLFQECLFQVGIEYMDPSSNTPTRLNASQVAQESSRLFVSHEASIGFGNDVWTTGWLSDVFMIYANCEPMSYRESCVFLARVFLYSKFEKSRILSIAKNLQSEITELKRDGMSMLVSIATRVGMGARKTDSNDLAMSIFRQESFLKYVIGLLESNQGEFVYGQLDLVRHHLLSCSSSISSIESNPTFAQFTIPKAFYTTSYNDVDSMETDGLTPIASHLLQIWEDQVQLYHPRNVLHQTASPFPFPRNPITSQDHDTAFSRSLIIPISGLGASFLFQIIECDVMLPHPDYYPLSLLVEILSRCEGPLYSKIRGQGFAYGVSLNLYLWTGQLCFELSDSSDPCKALETFYSILKSMESDTGFSDICNEYEIETARASLAYRFCTEKSTSLGISNQALKASLRGFSSIKEMDEFQYSQNVTQSDLRRVYSKYLTLFLNSSSTSTFITTRDGDSLHLLQQQLTSYTEIEEFEIQDLQDLSLTTNSLEKVGKNGIKM